MEFMPSLPTSGPLGKKENYEPTNRDLYNNALQQNALINDVSVAVNDLKVKVKNVDDKVQELATTVASHSEIVNQLKNIKSVALWILSFAGLEGIVELVKLFHH